MFLDVAFWLLYFCQATWMGAGALFHTHRDYSASWVQNIFFEGRPFMPYLCVAVYIVGGLSDPHVVTLWPRLLILVSGLVHWWISRFYDDDRWKKRAARVTGKVTLVLGRLKVTPI